LTRAFDRIPAKFATGIVGLRAVCGWNGPVRAGGCSPHRTQAFGGFAAFGLGYRSEPFRLCRQIAFRRKLGVGGTVRFLRNRAAGKRSRKDARTTASGRQRADDRRRTGAAPWVGRAPQWSFCVSAA
jgi:hypothetical protein